VRSTSAEATAEQVNFTQTTFLFSETALTHFASNNSFQTQNSFRAQVLKDF